MDKLKAIKIKNNDELRVLTISSKAFPYDVLNVIMEKKDFTDNAEFGNEFLIGTGQFDELSEDESLEAETREKFAYLYKKFANISYLLVI